MSEPKLRVRSSGHGGSGYLIPARRGDEFKEYKNTSGEKIKGRLVDGKQVTVPGVTTVLNKLEKSAVTQWAVDNTAAFAVANLDRLYTMTEEAGWGFLRWYWSRDPLKGDYTDIRNYSQGVLADAQGLGTMIHEWIAAEHGFGDYPDTTFAPDHFWQLVEQWHLLNQRHEITPLGTELTVFNEFEGYAGTLDGVWLVDGVKTLLDIKTSRNVYDSHWMQLAALSRCDTMYVEDEEGFWAPGPSELSGLPLAVVRLRPDDFDSKGLEVAAYGEIVYADNDEIEDHYQAFLGLLKTSQAMRRVAATRSAKEAQLKKNAGFPV